MRWLLVAALVGCGRVDFDTARLTCASGPVPDPLTISGMTFRYTTFDNQIAAVGTASVAAVEPNGPMLATTTSDAAGNYTLGFASGGMPAAVYLSYSRTGYDDTNVFFDEPLATDIVGAKQPLWSAGDGPLWNAAALTSIYSSVGLTRDTTKGTLNVAVRDCAGNALPGVTVTIDPPPPLAMYQASDGSLDASLTSTAQPFTHLVALNVEPGVTHVTASGPGLRFTELYFDVLPQVDSMAVIHGGP